MQMREVAEILHAVPMTAYDETAMSHELYSVFATDLMSDALAMIQNYEENTLLLTGLCNTQTLRTAEMLDVRCIVFVRGKYLLDDAINMANDMNLICLATDLTMYEACGRLYMKGLSGIYG